MSRKGKAIALAVAMGQMIVRIDGKKNLPSGV